MRRIIAAMQTSLDGLIEGPNGEVDWVGAWEDSFDLLPQIDTCILGRGMYAGYEQYWRAIVADPTGILPLTGQVPTAREIEYAHFADKTPHLVVSKTLHGVSWETARIVRDLEEIRNLKHQPGKDVYVVGGATLISNMMNAALVDELRLTVHPIILGEGKPLFKDVATRQPLGLVSATPTSSGQVSLTYRTT